MVNGSTCSCSQGQRGTNHTEGACLTCFLPHCHLCVPRLNPQPLAKDLEHRKYAEHLIPGAQPQLFAPPAGTHPLPLHCPADPLGGHWPSSTRYQCSHSLVPGSSQFSLLCRSRLSPRSQASHPGSSRSHRASKTTGNGREQPGKGSSPTSPRPAELNSTWSLCLSPPRPPLPQMWPLRSAL